MTSRSRVGGSRQNVTGVDIDLITMLLNVIKSMGVHGWVELNVTSCMYSRPYIQYICGMNYPTVVAMHEDKPIASVTDTQ